MGGFGREGWMDDCNRGGRSMGGAQNQSQMGFNGEGRIVDGEQFRSETGHFVHMRGLPYSATKQDIVQVKSFDRLGELAPLKAG